MTLYKKNRYKSYNKSNKKSYNKSYKKYPKRGGSRSTSTYSYRSELAQHRGTHQNRRSSKHLSQSKTGLASKAVSTRTVNSRIKLAERHAKKQFDSFKKQTEQVKTMLDKMIAKQATKSIYVDKIHLNNAWKNATNEYRKGNYLKSSHYLLLTLMTASVLLDRNKALTTSMSASTKLSNADGHALICGLLNTDADTPALYHKPKGKEITDRALGVRNFFKYMVGEKNILSENAENTDDAAENVFDFVYTCRNPYLKKLFEKTIELFIKVV